MQLSREEIIRFILVNNPVSKREELEKLSLTALVIMKTQIEIEKTKKWNCIIKTTRYKGAGVDTLLEAVFADVGVALLAILNAVRIQSIKFY